MAVRCAVVEHVRRSLLLDPFRVGDGLLLAEEVATELSHRGTCLACLSFPSDSLALALSSVAEIIDSGIKGGAVAAVAASADDEGGEDEAAEPKLKLRPRPVPKDNFRLTRAVPMPFPFPPALGETFAALSVFLLYDRSDTCTGGDGGGESTLTGDGPGPAVESSPPSTDPASLPTADIGSTVASSGANGADE